MHGQHTVAWLQQRYASRRPNKSNASPSYSHSQCSLSHGGGPSKFASAMVELGCTRCLQVLHHQGKWMLLSRLELRVEAGVFCFVLVRSTGTPQVGLLRASTSTTVIHVATKCNSTASTMAYQAVVSVVARACVRSVSGMAARRSVATMVASSSSASSSPACSGRPLAAVCQYTASTQPWVHSAARVGFGAAPVRCMGVMDQFQSALDSRKDKKMKEKRGAHVCLCACATRGLSVDAHTMTRCHRCCCWLVPDEVFTAQIKFISSKEQFTMEDHVMLVQVCYSFVSVPTAAFAIVAHTGALLHWLHHLSSIIQDIAKSQGLTGWRSKLRSSKAQQEILDNYPDMLVAEALTVSADPHTCCSTPQCHAPG